MILSYYIDYDLVLLLLSAGLEVTMTNDSMITIPQGSGFLQGNQTTAAVDVTSLATISDLVLFLLVHKSVNLTNVNGAANSISCAQRAAKLLKGLFPDEFVRFYATSGNQPSFDQSQEVWITAQHALGTALQTSLMQKFQALEDWIASNSAAQVAVPEAEAGEAAAGRDRPSKRQPTLNAIDKRRAFIAKGMEALRPTKTLPEDYSRSYFKK